MDAPEIIKKLKSRFLELWRRCLAEQGEVDAEPVWNELKNHYTQSGRHYHGVGHLAHCLELHDLAVAEMDDPDAVEMAIWFHDVVFEAQSRENERRSAELFQRAAADRFGSSFVEKVFQLILVTDHRVLPVTRDDEFVADIDLSGIALPWESYLRDTEALRRENREIPDDRYYGAHQRFLNGLRERRRIFHSDFFHRRCESDARRNIDRYLGQLEAAGRIPAPAEGP